MTNISNVRLTVPKTTAGEIVRQKLIDTIFHSQKKIIYIHAGAGYGKTTLLSQIANSSNCPVWLSLAGENDVFTFVDALCKSIGQTFPGYDFISSEYIPFMEKENFTTILANALINSVEKLQENFTLFLDDFHTITNVQIKELFACFMKYMPENIQLYISSRETPWQELVPLCVRGYILEIKQNELVFTREEVSQLLDFNDESLYTTTEGWPLAIGSFRVLLENGVSPADIPAQGNEALYSYLFYECISRLPFEVVNFLRVSACFEELDPCMLDGILNKKNTRLLLESLAARNIFTIKTRGGLYRYHTLFREALLKTLDTSQKQLLQLKTVQYYWDKKDFTKSAEYAIRLNNKKMLQKIILASYKDLMKTGSYSVLRSWFQALGNNIRASRPDILVAQGAFLSSIGNFTEAKTYLDKAIPMLKGHDQDFYMEAMIHRARVLRNTVSFEISNQLLDQLIGKLDHFTLETAYAVVIEKLYNLCWNSQINEAYALALEMIENCARAGNLKVRAWFERYLCPIHFFAGRMNQSVYYYEKSLNLSMEERQYLDIHGIGIYAAKAYQMLGDRSRSLSILTKELHKLRTTGKYEEMWSGYLFAAEIHFQNASIDRRNGKSANYETTMKYFTLADEYAPLFRKTDFQMQWAKMQRLTYSLMFINSPKEAIIQEIFANLDQAGDYLKSVILARLYGYFAAVSDFPNAVKCARLCIETGEKSNIYLHSTLAYGMLARSAILSGDRKNAGQYVQRFLRLCSANGIYEYFKARKDYDPILEFAADNSIEPDITRQIMSFAGYQAKKAYIKTFGGFSVFPYKEREKPLKMRTKKERELLAFLLNAGKSGVSKEQIYEALWSESKSENIKKLIGVNLAQIKKDLAVLGIKNSVICREKRYSLCKDEIECDFELFQAAADQFNLTSDRKAGLKLLDLYTGEYLSDFEAIWATSKRIKYSNIYYDALKTDL